MHDCPSFAKYKEWVILDQIITPLISKEKACFLTQIPRYLDFILCFFINWRVIHPTELLSAWGLNDYVKCFFVASGGHNNTEGA